MLAHHRQGAEGGWVKTMIDGSFDGKNTYQNTDFQNKWFLTDLMWLQVLLWKATYVMCLSSCESNDNLGNIITEGIPYLATVFRMVCTLLRIYSNSCGTQKNVSDFCVLLLEGIANMSWHSLSWPMNS